MTTYYYVYVLRSASDKMFYVGFTTNIRARLEAHSKGKVPSTKRRTPLELVYWEGCLSQTDATNREKYLNQRGESDILRIDFVIISRGKDDHDLYARA